MGEQRDGPVRIDYSRLARQLAGVTAVCAAALFGGAGTFAWSEGWIFLLMFTGFSVGLSLWLARNSPDLLHERLTGIGKPDQPLWDKVGVFVASLVMLGWVILMPLDAVRFGWSRMPLSLQLCGGVLLLVSFLVLFHTFRENRFLSPAVRIQSERQHSVVSSGPYAIVRHPMYSGIILMLTGTTLLLGSWYGLIPATLLALGMAGRTLQEEEELAAKLEGYPAYCRKVRYRLVPFVW